MKLIKPYLSLELYPHVDQVMVVLILALASIGFVIMSSASMSVADAKPYFDVFYFVKRQLLFIVMAAGAAYIAFLLPTHYWERWGLPLFAAAIVLLVLVLVVGKEVNGSKRWIPLGVFNLQASEVAKLFVMLYLAGYLVRRNALVRGEISGFITPMLMVGLAVGLIYIEPDFGSTVVLLASCMAMLFLAGLRLRYVAFLGAGAAVIVAFMAQATAYRVKRIECFRNPWDYAYDCGYQLTQSLIAFGRGEFWGVGLGKSIQKLFYLPEAHTDFVFAILAEELGFLGVLLVVALFAALIYRMFRLALTAERSQQFFAAYLSYGITVALAIQVFFNIGVNSGLLPTKGLTLPLLSYGGSSLIVTAVMFGILLRIDAELREKKAYSASENLRGRKVS